MTLLSAVSRARCSPRSRFDGTAAGPNNLFSAEDIPADAKLQGLSCLSVRLLQRRLSCRNNYYFNPDGSKIPVAPAPLIAALPQALLSRGTLAVIAHVDMAFPYAFQDVTGTPQLQALRDPLTYLMFGRRAGYAADSLSDRWSRLCSPAHRVRGADGGGRSECGVRR